jgi:hypothetical protein
MLHSRILRPTLSRRMEIVDATRFRRENLGRFKKGWRKRVASTISNGCLLDPHRPSF